MPACCSAMRGMQDALKARTSPAVLVLADQGNPEELLCGQSAAALTGKVWSRELYAAETRPETAGDSREYL